MHDLGQQGPSTQSPRPEEAAWRKQSAFLITLLGLLLTVFCVACLPTPKERGRLIVIGIDGASPRLIVPLMREGKLPNLAKIAEHGAYGKLKSLEPIYSPRIWNSIATGQLPRDHGITAFVYKEMKDSSDKSSSQSASKSAGVARLYLSHHRKIPAIWNILSAAGIKTGVVNWWTTFPPDLINGAIVSDHFFPEQLESFRKTFNAVDEGVAGLLYPGSLEDNAIAARDRGWSEGEFQSPFGADRRMPPWADRSGMEKQFRSDGAITRVALVIQEQIQPDALFVYLPGIDRVSHTLWGNLESEDLYPPTLRPEPADRRGGRQALELYYSYADGLIGLLTAGYGDDDLILVISDHGFEAGVKMMLLTGVHKSDAALDGIIFARGLGVRIGDAGHPSVLDIAPTILAWQGLPKGSDMPGKIAPFLSTTTNEMAVDYAGMKIERLPITNSAGSSSSPNEMGMLDELRALGYLEKDADGNEVEGRVDIVEQD